MLYDEKDSGDKNMDCFMINKKQRWLIILGDRHESKNYGDA